MNTQAPTPDPHASKISPDDPRLRVRPAPGRTLRKGPAIALVVVLSGTVTASLVVALLPTSKAADAKVEATPPAAPPPPLIPDTIRHGAESRANQPQPPPAGDRLLVVPLPEGGIPDDSLAHGVGGGYGTSEHDERIEQTQRARGSGILFEGTQGPPSPSQTPAPAAAPGSSPPPVGTIRPPSPETDPNLQIRKNAFVQSEGESKGMDLLRGGVEHPRSPYEIKAGTILPAVLVTAVNSDLPGPVIGQVRENVYDSLSGNHLLIPQGSRLLAQYDSMVAWGQERVLVCWNRLLFPNGDSLRLDCMPAADLAGAAGLADDVNEHWSRIVKGAAVASLLAATTQGVAGNTQGLSPTVSQTWARGAAGEVNQAGQQVVHRAMSIQPTITVRPGFSINVVVTKDMVLPHPYPVGS